MRLLLPACLLLTAAPARAADPAALAERVRPILEGRCVSCHGPDKAKGGLRLDTPDALKAGGDSGAALVPGKPDESLLVLAVRHAASAPPMPPKEKLSDKEAADLAAWVKAGAPWPAAVARPAKANLGDGWTDKDNPVVKAFNGQRLDLWSFRKPARPAEPAVTRAGWVCTPVDRFVLARLEAKGLAPSPEADRRTLLRRLAFDLTGLPPTAEEVEAFAKDQSPDAYERQVERLLASPAYGERWGRHWLDVVRYADTNGFERDEFKPDMWRYRDYVIKAFNDDKPFDRFVKEQIAGDELPDGPAAERWVATGYLRLGPYDSLQDDFQEKAKARDELMADLANTTAAAFLGLTLSCCQCHHHKYDPLTQQDHYRLRAFFAAVKPDDKFVLDPPAVAESVQRHNDAVDAEAAKREERRAGLVRVGKWRVVGKRLRESLLRGRVGQVASRLDVSDDDAKKALTASERAERDRLKKEVADLNGTKRPFTHAVVMTDGGTEAPPTRLNYQGDFHQPREDVPPGFPSLLDPNTAPAAKVGPATTGRRTALANWLVARDNPLTARVTVNRLWLHHFGKGLVATPNDFGFSGARPTHPELLDWLAVEFMDRGWSVKHLHRLMVLSAAYRQASVEDGRKSADPDNALLWRQNPRRLDAESLRDSLLAVSGRLLPERGGKPRWPPVPEELLRANPAILMGLDNQAEGRLQSYYPDPEERTDVRSVHLVRKRSMPAPLLAPFDLPESTTSCGCRTATTVAPQALTLLNGKDAVRLARAFADRVKGADDPVRAAFRLALARDPDADERGMAAALVERQGLVDLCRGLMNCNEFAYID